MNFLKSGKCKFFMLTAMGVAASAGSASAAVEVLAGWHDFSAGYGDYKTASSTKAPDEYLSGVAGFLYGGDGSRNTWGSTDGTYGSTLAVDTSATDGAISHRTDKPDMYLTVLNNTSSAVTLDSIVFDLASVSTTAPQNIALYYDRGDLAVADDTLINSASGVNGNGLSSVSDYQDFNWSLSALADKTLAAGQYAVFRLTVANAGNNTQALALDNIAILGEGTAGGNVADAMTLLKKHINGTGTLTASVINTQKNIINNNKWKVGSTGAAIRQAFDLVQTYETDVGYLFNNGEFSRTDTSTAAKALRLAVMAVYQAIVDKAYTASNLANHRDLFDGYKFKSANYFPGAVTPPADPDAVYSVQINASQPEAWGYPVQFGEESARRPTGAYLAPGSIATVTVPAALVGKGYEIRVGAHVADLTNRPNNYKRLDRVTITYPINSTTTEIASPLGGGIYIEVPYGIEEGLATVEFQNTVRAPFYSNSAARQTTLSEWQNTERSHPGAWADFETDKFMLTVPTDWIYNYNDPVSLMNKWDLAMDASSDLQGLPRVRPKTVLYCIIDVTLDANVFSPGYPQSNDNYNPTSSAGGNKDHDYLNGPKFADYVHLHEFGHASSITKFSGEVEAAVNLFYVPVHNRMFDVTLDEAFGRSMGNYGCRTVSRDQAALLWILSDKFRAGTAQAATDMKYQHRGYGKYVEIAGLFGWDALGDFWKSVAVDYENGITYSKNADPTDSRIIRMSRAAGANLLPLIHMWGVHPGNASSIQSTLDSEGIKPSAAIYDRLVHYQSIVPQTLAQFESHYQKVKNAPIDSDFFTTMRSNWNATYAAASIARVQEIIDTYFPDGRPIESLPHYEDFEDGIGGWAQATDDNFEWRRHSGPTLSPAAGPDGASSGDYYMYAEGHDAPGSAKTASFQCTFDFSTRRQTTLTFDYHMYGDYIDFLSVDVHDGISWNNNVWVRNGKQHNSSSAPWSTATVDLTDFSGNDEVTIRFRTKNTQYKSADPAIDNVRIDVGNVLLPYAESFENGLDAWVQSTDDNFDWTLNSGGTPTGGTGPSGASDGTCYLYTEPHDNYNGHNKIAQLECTFDLSEIVGAKFVFDYHMYGVNIDYLAIDIFDGAIWTTDVWKRTNAKHSSSEDAWSNAVVDLSAYDGNGEVTIRFRAKQYYWHVSDIAIDNIRIDLPPQTLPYAESFEEGIGAWKQSTDDDYNWTRHTGGTDTAAAGPGGASDGDYYLYAEGHHGLGSWKTSAVHCAFSFAVASEPEMSFDYHMYGGYIDFLSVDVHDGSAWALNVWTKDGQQHASSAAPWSTATVDLSAYAGNDEVTIRFRTANRVWNAADAAIDNISIVDVAETAYDVWAASAFEGAPAGMDTSAAGNPDGDRFSNLQEWALVLDPLVADAPAMDATVDSADFTVLYDRRLNSGVTVRAAWAASLDAEVWAPAGDGLTEASVETVGDVETMSATVPLDGDQKFIRIEVED